MPTYEYICKSCGHLFEIVQSMRDESLTECPECGGVLRKVFAPPAISFKGSGFYANDQREKATKPSGDKADKGDKSSESDPGSGDGKRDSKSDAKKDSTSDAPAASSKRETSSSSSGSTSDSSSGSSSKEGNGS